MSKYSVASLIVFTLITSGCASQKIVKTNELKLQSNPVVEKVNTKYDAWCNEGTGLRVVTENFNGMYHGPSFQHVCRDAKELFRLEMDGWDNTTGKLIARSSTSTFKSKTKDPEFKLLESKNSDLVSVSIDGTIMTYNEKTGTFSK